MPARIPHIQCPKPCGRFLTMGSRTPHCHRREILLLKLRANEMAHPAINQRADCPMMTLGLHGRAPLLPKPHPIPIRPDTNLLFRVSMPTIGFLQLPQKSRPTSRPRTLHRRLTMRNMLIPRPSRTRKSADPTAVPRATRTRRFHRIRRAGRASLEEGEADSPVIRSGDGSGLRLPARNWFAGEFPHLRAGKSS